MWNIFLMQQFLYSLQLLWFKSFWFFRHISDIVWQSHSVIKFGFLKKTHQQPKTFAVSQRHQSATLPDFPILPDNQIDRKRYILHLLWCIHNIRMKPYENFRHSKIWKDRQKTILHYLKWLIKLPKWIETSFIVDRSCCRAYLIAFYGSLLVLMFFH